jgi:hypothetical protein
MSRKLTTDMDELVLENCELERRDQPEWKGEAIHRELD